jgi:hypothetical protein
VAAFGIGAQGARAGSSAHRDYVARSVFNGWSRPLGLHKATVVPGAFSPMGTSAAKAGARQCLSMQR